MIPPVRSYSYGPDSSNDSALTASAKKRKRTGEGEDNLSLRLPSLAGSQPPQSVLPSPSGARPQFQVSDRDSFFSAADESPVADDRPVVFSSPRPQHLHTPRKMANPYKRAHFNRPSAATPLSSPIIARTPSLTFSSDSLSQISQLNTATTVACHLCGHRPANVQDLAAYVDCETCRQRTCSVCTRVCEGPRCRPIMSTRQTLFSGATPRTAPDGDAPRGKVVCRQCCTEVGVDGHIWCTACYADDTELEDFAFNKNKKSLANESLGRIASWLQDCGPDDAMATDCSDNGNNGGGGLGGIGVADGSMIDSW